MLGLLLFLPVLVVGQSYSRGQSFLFVDPSTCTNNEYFAPHNYSCAPCPLGLAASPGHLSCQCALNSIITNITAAGLTCTRCGPGEIALAGRCISCPTADCNCGPNEILQQNGCALCPADFVPNSDKTRCIPCQSLFCFCQNGTCSQGQSEAKTEVWLSDGTAVRSVYLEGEVHSTMGRCQQGSSQDCQALLNMCVLQHFDRSSFTACSIADRIAPQLFGNFILDGDVDSEVKKETAIQEIYVMGEAVDILAALFDRNGSFIQLTSLQDSKMLLCPLPEQSIFMGRRFLQSCSVSVLELQEQARQLFVEMFVRFTDENGLQRLYPISVLNKQMRGNGQYINKEGSNRQQLVRRFFLSDSSAQFTNGTPIMRFLSTMSLQIFLQNACEKLYRRVLNLQKWRRNYQDLAIEEQNRPECPSGTTGAPVKSRQQRATSFRPIFVMPKLAKNAVDGKDEKNRGTPSRDGLIFPPFVVIDYSETAINVTSVTTVFSTLFASDPERHDRDLEIAMAVLCPMSIIWAGLKTYSWGRRNGKQLISDLSVVIQFLLFSCSCLGEVFFLIPSITAVWITVAYKMQYYYFYNVLSTSQENTLRLYLLFAVILKGFSVLQKMWQLVMQQTLFIDWEKPRTVVDQSIRPASQDAVKSTKELPPVAWRTYMVANEWNELFSYRKTSITIQLLAIFVLLDHFGWMNWALVEPGFSTSPQGAVQSTNLTKFGVLVLIYLGVALVQWVLQVLLLERILFDPFHNFIDLCSVANISVMSLTHSLYGYYIHGRSVHGRGDVSMGEMNEFLKRERDNLCANRGLEPGTELQTFTAALPAAFQEKLQNIQGGNYSNNNLRGFDHFSAKMDKITQKHEMVNAFVREFIDHSLSEIDYGIRDATFVEALLDVETNDTTFMGHLSRDPSEMAFASCFLYGNEWIFLSFETALFCSLALWLDSLTLTCFLVFVVSSFTRLLCCFVAKNQVAKASLVDDRFLL